MEKSWGRPFHLRGPCDSEHGGGKAPVLSKGQENCGKEHSLRKERHRAILRSLNFIPEAARDHRKIFQVTQKKSDMILGESASKNPPDWCVWVT